MFRFYQIFSIFLFSLTIECNCYKILIVYPFNSPSHNIFLESISIGLAKRGHQIDAISHYKPKNPPDNYKTIVYLNGTRPNVVNNMTIDFASQIGTNTVTFIATTFGNELCDLMGLDKMQELIKNSPKHRPYDLIITEVRMLYLLLICIFIFIYIACSSMLIYSVPVFHYVFIFQNKICMYFEEKEEKQRRKQFGVMFAISKMKIRKIFKADRF